MNTQTKAPNLADTIFEDLRKKILGDHWKAGDRLPPERDLAIEYETNRNTLREAIRKLEQSRLITVRHGSGARIEDFRKKAHFDLLGPFLEHASENRERLQVLRDLLVSRTQVLEMVMQMAARQAKPEDIDRLHALTEHQQTLFASGDQVRVARGDLRWHRALVEAAHSLTIRWMANTFLDVYRGFILRFPHFWILHPEYPGFLGDVIGALRERDPARAVSTTRNYYKMIDARMIETLEALLLDFGRETK